MTPPSIRHLALIFVILCVVCSIESRDRPPSRRGEKPKSGGLCSKDIDMKLHCHCTYDQNKRIVIDADCLVLHKELSHSDPAWRGFQQHNHINHIVIAVARVGYLGYFPKDVIKNQRDLNTITIQYASIREIPTFAFSNLTQLQNISLIDNKIEVIEPFAFANHLELRAINLDENQIIMIDRYAFSNLPALYELILTKNNITALHNDMFNDLINLSKLKLNENVISTLTKDVFKGLGNLKQLDLSYNNLRMIGDTVFSELWSLQELDLYNNNLERLSERAFDGLNNLRILNLEHNRLAVLEGGVFSGVPAVTTLNLNHNLLETLTYNNVLPIMDNLVNNTSSVLSISENRFICECRLNWIFELFNRTKNSDLRRTLERTTCYRDISPANALTIDSTQYNNYKTAQRPSQTFSNEYDLDDSFHHNNDLGNRLDDFDSKPHQEINRESVPLFTLDVNHLPCESLTEPTELPLSRESVGMDLSRVFQFSAASDAIKGNLIAICMLILASRIVIS